jgi:diaminohydroxyphosphoribosylaminopyrimidine deaminase/5-amino-6-(5-phosphoribosylamino)uracil reductase
VTDSRLRIPLTARILSQQNKAKTIVATTSLASATRRAALARQGVETMLLPMAHGQVSLSALLKELGRRGITSLLLEGGSQLNGAMLRAKLVDHIRLYIAPALLGGEDAKGLIGGNSPAHLDQSLTFSHVRFRSVGRDIVVEGDV